MMRANGTRVLLTALLAAGAFAVTGCGAEGSAEKQPAADEAPKESTSASASAEAPDRGGVPASLRFAGTTLDGKPFKGKKLADKPAVLWFWAPWCGTCQGQAAHTAKLAGKYKGKVNFVGVAGLDKTKPMRGFVSAQKVGNFPHLNDQKGSVWKKFGITQQSSYVLLDKNGKTVHEGVPGSPAELDKLVTDLTG
ncbi:MAG: TlpA family protein disulfide reductase [Streptomyces sp.]|uniref:TlpA family protein disulfide reductase n=1 Tax=Streptomyces sp. TaxID=1931 RepID=UPI003D6B0A43